jgi:hypothetical protein
MFPPFVGPWLRGCHAINDMKSKEESSFCEQKEAKKL